MGEINKELRFYTSDYSLVLNFDKDGGISGRFLLLDDYPARREYSCTGYYFIPRRKTINLAFTIDWSTPTENEFDFTCFSGQILNQHVLVLDWMLIHQRDEETTAVNGSSFLYSPPRHDSKEGTLEVVKPFPISI